MQRIFETKDDRLTDQLFSLLVEDRMYYFNVDWLLRQIPIWKNPIVWIEMEKEFANVCRLRRGIEQAKYESITYAYCVNHPVLYAKDLIPGTHSLIDGHHRYVWLDDKGATGINAYVLEPEQWRQGMRRVPEAMYQADLKEFKAIDNATM